jgi:hypothetical protein
MTRWLNTGSTLSLTLKISCITQFNLCVQTFSWELCFQAVSNTSEKYHDNLISTCYILHTQTHTHKLWWIIFKHFFQFYLQHFINRRSNNKQPGYVSTCHKWNLSERILKFLLIWNVCIEQLNYTVTYLYLRGNNLGFWIRWIYLLNTHRSWLQV